MKNKLALIRKNYLIFLALGIIGILYIVFVMALPEITNLILTSTNSLTNDTNTNLSISFTTNATKNITNWYINGASWTVLNMPFEGGSNGTFTKDYSGYGNNGTVVGATWNSTGGYDGKGAYEFNAVSTNKITIANQVLAENITSFTISAWIKANNKTATFYPAIYNHNWCSSKIGYLMFYLTATKQVLFGVSTTGCGQYTVAAAITDDTWTYIVGVYNGTDSSIYKNGIFVNKYAGGVPQMNTSSGGGDAFGGGLNGSIDELQIFNRPLSAQEISAIYNNRTDLIVSQETTLNENWSACVTPNDGIADGVQVCSNNLTILNGASVISFVSPTDANMSYLPRGNILINATATDMDGLSNITINLYNSTSLVNSSVSTTSPYYVNITSLLDGSYWFNVSVLDIVNALTSTTTYKVILDTVFPQVNFTGQTSSSGTYQSGTSIPVNISSSDTNSHYTVVDFDNSLVGWWRMEQGNGTFFKDEQGKNNGTCSSTACPIYSSAGAFGGTQGFDGVNDYVVTSLNFSNFNAFTISAWVNAISNTTSTIASSGYTVTALESFVLQRSTTPKFRLTVYNNTGSSNCDLNSGNVTGLNSWDFVTAIVNTTNCSIYVNGILQATRAMKYPISINVGSIEIGARSLGNSQNFNGSIDEVMIFNRSLSAGEIASLYNATKTQYYNNFTGLSDGVHTFKGYSVDKSGNKNSTEMRNVTVDSTMPNGTLILPIDNWSPNSGGGGGLISVNYSDHTSVFNFTVNMTDNIGIKNATIYIYHQNGTLFNQTTNVLPTGTTWSLIGIIIKLVDGVYTWLFKIIDLAGNTFTTTNRTLDTTLCNYTTGNWDISRYCEYNGTYNVAGNVSVWDGGQMNCTGICTLNISSRDYWVWMNATTSINDKLTGKWVLLWN